MNELSSINWGIIAPIIVINLILVIVALFSLIKAPATRGPKLLWAIIILFIGIIGPVLYFVIGRKEE